MAVLGSARGAVCSLLVHDLNGRVRPSGASGGAKNAIAVESCGKREGNLLARSRLAATW
jgi:hypothetical protein